MPQNMRETLLARGPVEATQTAQAAQLAEVAQRDALRLIKRVTVGAAANAVTIDKDADGNSFTLAKARILLIAPAGVSEDTDGTVVVSTSVNDISGANTYLRNTTAASGGWGCGAGNLATYLDIRLAAVGNRLLGSYLQMCAYGAAWPGTGSGSASGLLTASNAGFATINKVVLTAASGTGIHAGAVVELWGIDA